jgi:hypothetical protein
MAGSLFPLFAARGGDSADSFLTTTRNGFGRLMATGGYKNVIQLFIFKAIGECLLASSSAHSMTKKIHWSLNYWQNGTILDLISHGPYGGIEITF